MSNPSSPLAAPRHRSLRTVVLTGGNGYLGSEMVRQLLAQGAVVHAIVNRNADRLEMLLPAQNIHRLASDYEAVANLVVSLEPDAIFHLAAIHAEPPTFHQMMGMLNGSLLLGVALLHGASAARNHPVVVHAGTYWQFDHSVYSPNTFYAAAKQAFHDMLAYYRLAQHIPSMTLVLYDIFGPDDTRPKLWSRILEAPAGSRFPTTEGRQAIELVHVADIAQAFIHAASLLLGNAPVEPIYAVRSAHRMTLRHLLEQVRERTGLDLEFDWGAIPYWPGQIFEPWEGPVLPGWTPTVDPIDGITTLVSRALKLSSR